jgi:hypothetical protein
MTFVRRHSIESRSEREFRGRRPDRTQNSREEGKVGRGGLIFLCGSGEVMLDWEHEVFAQMVKSPETASDGRTGMQASLQAGKWFSYAKTGVSFRGHPCSMASRRLAQEAKCQTGNRADMQTGRLLTCQTGKQANRPALCLETEWPNCPLSPCCAPQQTYKFP